MTKLEELKIAYEAATLDTGEKPDLHATNADLVGRPLPLEMYETTYTYAGDRLVSGEVRPITVTRFGVATDVGATAPSISFKDWSGRRAMGSARLFYMNQQYAQAEVDYNMAMAKKEAGEEQFIALAHTMIPAFLRLFAAVGRVLDEDGDLLTSDMSEVVSAMKELK